MNVCVRVGASVVIIRARVNAKRAELEAKITFDIEVENPLSESEAKTGNDDTTTG